MNKLLMKVMAKITDSDSDTPSLDGLLDKSDAIFADVAVDPTRSAPNSKERHTFGFGSPFDTMNLTQMARIMPTMIREQASFRNGMKLARTFEQLPPRVASSDLSAEIAASLKRWGAAEVGVVDVPQHAVFRDRVAPLPRAIVFTGEMNRELMKHAPTFEGMREVAAAYERTGVMANRLSVHLRGLGYNAIPGHSMGGTVDYPLLGEMAGIGQLGRNGLLISQTHGVSQRIAVVFTDIEALDFQQAEEYSWVSDFCKTCGKCIRACPAGALHEEWRPDESGQLTSTDGDLCLPYFGEHWGCSICVGVCPFTRSDYAAIKRSFEKRAVRESGSSSAHPVSATG